MKSSGRTTGGLSALFAAVILVIGMDALPALGQDMPQRQASPSTTWTPPPPPKVTAKQPKPMVVKPSVLPAAPRTAAPATTTGAPPVIIDTDMFGSADDAGALAVANALQDNGKIKVLGVVVNYASQWGAPAASAINTYYGHGDIPVGSIKPATTEVAGSPEYAKYVAQNFPNSIPGNDGNNAPDATALYRQLLAGAADHSVVIVGIGLETNLKNLMNSPVGANGVAQSGMELITSKVKSLTMMGGQFPSSTLGPEYNWKADASAATQVVNEWPTSVPATFEGYEVGHTVLTGAGLAKTPANNPVRVAYEHMNGAATSMSSWDSIAMYFAGMGLDGLFTDSNDGSVMVDSVGGNTWSTTVKPQHYLVKSASDSAIATKVEALLDQKPGGSSSSDPIVVKYESMGGSSSFLGNPVGAEKTPTADGKEQDYQNGAIYWTTATGAHVVHGAFLAKYRQLGGPAGTLGYPAMDEAAVGDKVGEWIKFSRSSGARLYWTSQIGAHAVYGAILAEYLRFGGPTSTLGYPITDESAAVGGRYNHFSRAGGASIYWSSGTGAHAIYGAIRSRWASLGWERSRLGFPTTNEYGYPGGRRNEFQHGTISWTRATGAITVHYW